VSSPAGPKDLAIIPDALATEQLLTDRQGDMPIRARGGRRRLSGPYTKRPPSHTRAPLLLRAIELVASVSPSRLIAFCAESHVEHRLSACRSATAVGTPQPNDPARNRT